MFVDVAHWAVTGEKSSDQPNAYSSIVANMPPSKKEIDRRHHQRKQIVSQLLLLVNARGDAYAS
jgi:hypothetical protein